MEQLPPVGWADVATKHDLAALEERIDLRFEALRHELHGEIGNLRGELHGEMGSLRGEVFRAMAEQTRTVIVAMLSGMVGVGGLAFAAAHLT